MAFANDDVVDNGNQTSMGQAMDKAQQRQRPGQPNSNAGQQPARATQQQQQQKKGNSMNQQSQKWSWQNTGRLGSTPMGRTVAGEVLTKIYAAISEMFGTANQAFEIITIPMDVNNNTQLRCSTIIVAVYDRNAQNLGAAYHALLLAGSVEQLDTQYQNINGKQVEVTYLASDYYDDHLRGVVFNAVQEQLPNITLYETDACVVPSDFNVEDKNLVHRLAANALYACTTMLDQNRPDFTDMCLADAENDSTLSARVSFNNDQTIDYAGQPVRTDVVIDLMATSNQRQVGGSPERATRVTTVGAYVDLVYDPEETAQQNVFIQQQQQQSQTRRTYQANMVITMLESVALPTLPAQLIALATTSALVEGNNWAMAFKPRNYGSDIDMHDIGAVGIEANITNDPSGFGAKFDTKADSFRGEHFQQLISTFIRQGLVVSLDVAECGPDTWINSPFAAAGMGNPQANQAIIDAANVLTDGLFDQHYQGNGVVCSAQNDRIHLGTYEDRKGVKRDIRDIDTLAVANLVGTKDPMVLRDYSESHLASGQDLNERLAVRKKIILGLTNDRAEFTGYATRVTFDPEFIRALVSSCAAAGLKMRPQFPHQDVGMSERSTGAFARSAALGPQASGLFSSFGNRSDGSQGRTGSWGRWGGRG